MPRRRCCLSLWKGPRPPFAAAPFVACAGAVAIATFLAAGGAAAADPPARSDVGRRAPNASASPANPDVFAAACRTDKRLQTLVSVRAADRPLETLLEELGAQAKVSLRPARTYEDRAVTVRVEKMPLGDLLRAIANLYGDAWKPDAPGGGYVLEATTARRGRERRLREAYARIEREALMDEARAWAANGPELLPGGDKADKAEHEAFRPEAMGLGAVFSQLPPGDLDRLFAGERVLVNLAEASGDFGDALSAFAEAQKWPAEHKDITIDFSVETDEHNFPADFSVPPWLTLPLRSLTFRYTGARYGISTHPRTFGPRVQKELERLRRGEKQSAEERRARGGATLARALPEEGKERNLLAAGSRLTRAERFLALADAADLNVVSDAHTKPPVTDKTGIAAGQSVEQALDGVCALHGCYWRVDKNDAPSPILLVRSDWWWVDDAAEPPARASARWQELLNTDGLLPLDESLRVAVLSPEQQARLVRRIPEAGSLYGSWMRLYAGLDAGQISAARSPNGLPLTRISEAQRRLLIGRIDDQDTLQAIGRSDGVLTIKHHAIADVPPQGPVPDSASGVVRAVGVRLDPLTDSAGRRRWYGTGAWIRLPQRSPKTPPKSPPAPPPTKG